MEEKNGLWFLRVFFFFKCVCFHSVFKAVVYSELIIYFCLLNSKRKG